MAKTKKVDYTYAVGKRRTAVARVRLYRGKGENTVNGKEFSKYFEGEIANKLIVRPFGVTETSDKYYFSARVVGGGKNSQLEAIILGISRGLSKIAPEKNNPLLRKMGLLTRDGRERQRRMVGKGGKSRRKKQSPKR